MNQQTLDYYAQNANAFANSTLNIDMSEFYNAFIPHLPSAEGCPNGLKPHILDAGCGSGRDALHFKNLGYKVTAFDACAELAEIASFHLEQSVYVKTFRQISDQNQYDGIWCCASLLHVAHVELPDRFTKLANALKPNGLLYVSFKYGEGERDINGRHFTDLTEQSLQTLIDNEPQLTLQKVWQSEDQRPERKGELWLNGLIIRG